MRRDAGQDEDARADDCSHAQARKLDGAEDALQSILALKFLNERFVRLYLKQLIRHIHLWSFGRSDQSMRIGRDYAFVLKNFRL